MRKILPQAIGNVGVEIHALLLTPKDKILSRTQRTGSRANVMLFYG